MATSEQLHELGQSGQRHAGLPVHDRPEGIGHGRRLTLHVGGGITWRSDPVAEWAETEVKALGPLSAIGAMEVAA